MHNLNHLLEDLAPAAGSYEEMAGKLSATFNTSKKQHPLLPEEMPSWDSPLLQGRQLLLALKPASAANCGEPSPAPAPAASNAAAQPALAGGQDLTALIQAMTADFKQHTTQLLGQVEERAAKRARIDMPANILDWCKQGLAHPTSRDGLALRGLAHALELLRNNGSI